MLIGFAGKMRSGKTAAANYLINRYGVEKMSFAAPLKEVVANLFEWDINDLNDFKFKETVDPYWNITPREVLQKFGTDFMREMINPAFWTMKLERHLITKMLKHNVVIDDVRFKEEVDLIHKHRGIIVLLERGWKSIDTHSSEIIDFKYDHIIQNQGDCLSDLHAEIERLVSPGTSTDEGI